jgi:hypothetical protein
MARPAGRNRKVQIERHRNQIVDGLAVPCLSIHSNLIVRHQPPIDPARLNYSVLSGGRASKGIVDFAQVRIAFA